MSSETLLARLLTDIFTFLLLKVITESDERKTQKINENLLPLQKGFKNY